MKKKHRTKLLKVWANLNVGLAYLKLLVDEGSITETKNAKFPGGLNVARQEMTSALILVDELVTDTAEK